MSHIYDALKKLDRETSTKRFGWGTIGKDILKPEPARPRKKTSSYLIHVILTACATAAVTYGVSLNSDLLWKSPSPSGEISPALGPQVVQISPGVTEASKTLPLAPDERIVNIQPGAAERTKISPPRPAKSPVPIQKPAPPSTDGSSARKSSPTPLPRYGLPKLKSAPPAGVSGSAAKAPSLPRVRHPATDKEDIEDPLRTTQELPSPNIPPETKLDAETIRQQREEMREKYMQWREALRQHRADYEKNLLSPERKIQVPPATEGIASPPINPRVPEVLPGSSSPPATQSKKISDEGLPRLKISGIVWDEQPGKRRAVINGSFAAEGSEIQGVKVVEIFPTRVRFSYRDQVFELSAFE